MRQITFNRVDSVEGECTVRSSERVCGRGRFKLVGFVAIASLRSIAVHCQRAQHVVRKSDVPQAVEIGIAWVARWGTLPCWRSFGPRSQFPWVRAIIFSLCFLGLMDDASPGRLLHGALLVVLPDQTSVTEFYLVKVDRVA